MIDKARFGWVTLTNKAEALGLSETLQLMKTAFQQAVLHRARLQEMAMKQTATGIEA